MLTASKGEMDRGSIYRCLQGLKEQTCLGKSIWKKVLQGKTGSYLKVIKNKVLTAGGIFSSGILCSGTIILTEKTMSLKSFRLIFIGLYVNVVMKGLISHVLREFEGNPGWRSLCSCLGRFPGCQCMNQFSLFSSTCLCCS